jgi:hypothetical protein
MPNSVTYLNLTPMFKWCVIRCAFKNTHQKYMYLKDWTTLNVVHPNLHNVTPSLTSQNPRDVLSLNHLPCCDTYLPFITYFDIKIIHPTMCLNTSRCPHCHYCNVDFVLFHTITQYTISLLSCIHVNTTTLLK